jgi:hypothetical protein
MIRLGRGSPAEAVSAFGATKDCSKASLRFELFLTASMGMFVTDVFWEIPESL